MKTIGLFAVASVLIFASTSTAGLQLTVNGVPTSEAYFRDGSVVWIGIANDAGDDQFNAAIILTSIPWFYSGWTGKSRLNRPIGNAQGWEYFGPIEGYGDLWYAWFAQPVTEKLPAGIIGEVGFIVRDGDINSIVLTDGDLNVVGSLLVIGTPEPATLALLGLGAMMIRRKHSA